LRRAQAELINSLGRILLIVLLSLLMAIQLGFFTGQHVENQALQATIIETRLLDGLAPPGALPGIVNPALLTDKRLVDTYLEGFGDDNRWGAHVALFQSRRDLEAGTPLKEARLNQKALNLLPLARAGVTGAAAYWNLTLPVTVEQEPAWLLIEVVRRE